MDEIEIGEIIVDEELEIGEIELDVIKIEPDAEQIEITPTKEEQIEKGFFNEVIVKGDKNLVPENIKKDVEIFGVIGNVEPIGEENAIIDVDGLATNTSTSNNYVLNKLIVKVPEIDTSGWTSTAYLFYYCKNLSEIPQLDTSNVTNMSHMFYECNSLTKISGLDTSNATNIYRLFYSCRNLSEISQLDTSNVTNMSEMFYWCLALTNLQELDASKVVSVNNTFNGTSYLENFGGLRNIGQAYTQKTSNYTNYRNSYFSCSYLTHESLMNVINNLYDLNLTYDVANGGTLYSQTLQLGSTNLAKLTPEEIAIATSKGWNVT